MSHFDELWSALGAPILFDRHGDCIDWYISNSATAQPAQVRAVLGVVQETENIADEDGISIDRQRECLVLRDADQTYGGVDEIDVQHYFFAEGEWWDVARIMDRSLTSTNVMARARELQQRQSQEMQYRIPPR